MNEPLHQELATRLKSLERGDGIEVADDEALDELFNEIEAEVDLAVFQRRAEEP